MKKLLAVFLFLFFISKSYAEKEDLTLINDIDCDDVELNVSGANSDVYIYTKTSTIAKFPIPAKQIILGDYIWSDEKKYKVECPLFNISYDGNVLLVSASDFKSITNLFKNKRYRNINLSGAFKNIYENEGAVYLFNSGGYKFPELKVGFSSSGYNLNLESLWLVENNLSLKEARTYTRNDYQVQKLKDAVIAYSVDGKELKPFFFNNVVYPTTQEFNEAKKIEIFHKRANVDEVGVILEKIEIDKTTNTLKLYKNFTFPKAP